MRLLIGIFILLSLVYNAKTIAEIYRWTDSRGHVHYSDTPPPKIMPEAGSSVAQRERAAKIQKEFQASRGQAVLRKVEGGEFVQYRAKSFKVGGPILVLAHGQLDERLPESQSVANIVSKWLPFAEQHGMLLVAPVFFDANFGVKTDGPHQFGYRGLFGRYVNADEFVLQILAYYQENIRGFEKQFYMVGLEGGAQFVNRFVIVHPEKVNGAVLVKPDWFAFPYEDVQWPNGMAARYRMAAWPGKKEKNIVKVELDVNAWLAASHVNTAVIVGADDKDTLAAHAEIAEHTWAKNANSVSNAQRWVSEMRQLTQEHGASSAIQLYRVNGIGADVSALQPKAEEALSSFL
ncbi:DUF4124 domain-containing protein [Aurantivibrio plasticivorans]